VIAPRTIALPIGDPNGIGPELAVKAAIALKDSVDIRPVLFGDRFVIEHYASTLGVALRETDGAADPAMDAIGIRPVDSLPAGAFHPGRVCAEAGSATIAYVEAAVHYLRAGHAGAIVACPHNESAVRAAGIPFAGYPGLIARLMGLAEDQVFLMLIGAGLRIVHVTLHERLEDALRRLTPELVEASALAAIEALRAQGVANPRIGIFGINPHAGENGLFGDDDDRITGPAAARLREAGHQIEGPTGADLLLGREDIDAFIAMYHDQGHIPIKLLAGRGAAALSIGAGFIFSTVGHGSAFDIAGTGVADPEPLLHAIRLVAGRDSARSRQSDS
jgi:4-hydroxythreonine-4-phosphate dehydrogenase